MHYASSKTRSRKILIEFYMGFMYMLYAYMLYILYMCVLTLKWQQLLRRHADDPVDDDQ